MITIEKLPEDIGYHDVEVEWELGDQYDEAGDGYCFMHQADGISKEGHIFQGSGTVVCGEWESVEQVEFIGMENDV